MSDDIGLTTVELRLCDLCLSGAGGECHSPGCALWMNRAPDIPLTDDYGQPYLRSLSAATTPNPTTPTTESRGQLGERVQGVAAAGLAPTPRGEHDNAGRPNAAPPSGRGAPLVTNHHALAVLARIAEGIQ